MLTNYSLKLSKIYLQLVNRLTTFHTTFHIMLITVMVLIMFISGCTTIPPNKVHTGHFHIRDKRDITHSYKIPIRMDSHTELTVFCKDHKKWEIIRATWNGQRLVYTIKNQRRMWLPL